MPCGHQWGTHWYSPVGVVIGYILLELTMYLPIAVVEEEANYSWSMVSIIFFLLVSDRAL
jgi:hypothetical protein